MAISFEEEIFDLSEIRDWIDELKGVESKLDVRYRRGALAEAEFALREGKLQGLTKLLLDFFISFTVFSSNEFIFTKIPFLFSLYLILFLINTFNILL